MLAELLLSSLFTSGGFLGAGHATPSPPRQPRRVGTRSPCPACWGASHSPTSMTLHLPRGGREALVGAHVPPSALDAC